MLFDLLHSAAKGGIVFSDGIGGNPGDLLKKACAFGLEGVVSKRRDSPYRSGRREEWVKTKCINTDEFIVIGYEPGGSSGGLGSLLLATAKNGKLVYVGGVGTGFNGRSAPALKAMLDELTTAKPAIAGLRNKQAVWTKPEIVVEIEFRGWTEDGQLRHPSFQRVRADRSVSEFL
jgi:bifunctional non-homologous end joining protein LigD